MQCEGNQQGDTEGDSTTHSSQEGRTDQQDLRELQQVEHIAGIRNNGKKNWISSIRDEKGEMQESRDDIANAFADFYAILYDGSEDVLQQGLLASTCIGILPVDFEEVRAQLK